MLAHSSGRLFRLGNLTPANPHGNRPRYPFVIGEVDRETGGIALRMTRLFALPDGWAGDAYLYRIPV